MKTLTILFLIIVQQLSFAQGIDRTPSGYFSLSATGFVKTSTQISKSEGNNLKGTFSPGSDLTLNYTRINRSGITISSGLGATMLPFSYMFTIQTKDYNLPSELGQSLVHRNYEVGNIFFHVPVTVGYTFKKRKLLEPSLQMGVDLFYLNSFSIVNSYGTYHDNGAPAPIFELRLRSPHSGQPKIGLAYKFVGKVTRIVDSKSTFSAGIVANVSPKTVYQGVYSFYRQDGTRSGTYTDKGSYVGLQIGYVF